MGPSGGENSALSDTSDSFFLSDAYSLSCCLVIGKVSLGDSELDEELELEVDLESELEELEFSEGASLDFF